VTLQGVPISLNNDAAATSFSESVAMSFILLAPAVNAADQFALQRSTGANATANVNGTDPNTGGAVLNVEELSSDSTTVGPVGGDLLFDCRIANTPQGIVDQVLSGFTLAQTVDPAIQLVDINLAGGGAGNVYMVELCYRVPPPGDVAFPAVSDLNVVAGFGPNKSTNNTSLNRWTVANPTATLEFWAEGCSGDGAEWLTLLVYVPGIGGLGLLARQAGGGGDENTALTLRAPPPERVNPFVGKTSATTPSSLIVGGKAASRLASPVVAAPALNFVPQPFQALPPSKALVTIPK
jgi:hypothetical protein